MSEKNETRNELPVSSEALASALHFALLKEAQGDYDIAAAAFKALLLIDPSNPYFHAMLGSIYQKKGDSEGAVREYTAAIRIFPSDIDSLTNLGEIFLKTGRRDEAIPHLKQAVEFDTEGNHPSANRARLLLNGI
jgi:tetratricopeptide (TPR) repeat protein